MTYMTETPDAPSPTAPSQHVAVPAYLLEHDDPASLFTRSQPVRIHLELLQHDAMRCAGPGPRRPAPVIGRLTAKGLAIADRALASYDAIRRRVFARLSDDELRALDGAITTLLAALDNDLEERSA
jgi:hypothetical protein